MLEVSDDDFEAMVKKGIDAIPERYAKAMDNVGVTWENEPTPQQRHKLQLRGDQTLFGLYEGIPLTQRGAGYSMVLPDKITVFKWPLIWVSSSLQGLQNQINKTIWHEVAHHFGLDHDRIHKLEGE